MANFNRIVTPPKYDQATKIIARFGGARRLAKAMGLSPVSVYRWTYPRSSGGTDGLIPSTSTSLIRDTARHEGVLLHASDWTPNLTEAA